MKQHEEKSRRQNNHRFSSYAHNHESDTFYLSLRNDAKTAMVCTANDLLRWKDFPKGLKVLLLDEDQDYASKIKSKLEEMEYIVSAFSCENEALSAISSKSENFHIAIVEVNVENSNGRFRFLESAKNLPTIMTSDMHCLITMMKCIALGAVEFLKKPLSEEKLKNIWQHVVHKAFNAGGGVSPELIKPIKEAVVSESELKIAHAGTEKEVSIEPENIPKLQESEQDVLSNSDKFPAPSTPQIKQGGRFLDDVDYHDQTNSSTDRDNGEHDGESSKSVETKYECSAVDAKVVDTPPLQRPPPLQRSAEAVIKKENHPRVDGSKYVDNMSPQPQDNAGPAVITGATENPKRVTSSPNASIGSKATANRKKAKVDWTPDLHKKFVQAVEQLGVDQAIPSRILELMKVEGLTRHNVASHLQKYRMQRRHILPKEDERRWPQPRASLQRSYYPHHRPVMAFPPYHSIHNYPAGLVYPMWAQLPTNQPQNIKMCGLPAYPWKNPVENWLWKPTYPGVHTDAWGCPVMSTTQSPHSSIPEYVWLVQGTPGFHNQGGYGMPRNSTDLQPGEEEVIDKVVREAMSKPWLPLPIGLKPPSTESVLAELSRQGISISTVPPHSINGRPS